MRKKKHYLLDSMTSKAFWQYIFLTKEGLKSIFAIFGGLYLFLEALDFFSIYSKDKYASYTFFLVLGVSIIVSIILKRPLKSISVKLANLDLIVEVRIGNIFSIEGATVISTNHIFEADVASGRIAPNSLQGQFTAKYFTGNQKELIDIIDTELKKIKITSPYPMGTTIQINTHGKTFYFTVMAELNDQGNAYTTLGNVEQAVNGLWKYILMLENYRN